MRPSNRRASGTVHPERLVTDTTSSALGPLLSRRTSSAGHAGGGSATLCGSTPMQRGEPAQPQAVGDDEDGAECHCGGGGGDERVEQPGSGQRPRGDVVGE